MKSLEERQDIYIKEQYKKIVDNMKDKHLFTIGKFRVSFAWYDIWIGLFIDANKCKKYLCPLPCLLIAWSYKK